MTASLSQRASDTDTAFQRTVSEFNICGKILSSAGRASRRALKLWLSSLLGVDSYRRHHCCQLTDLLDNKPSQPFYGPFSGPSGWAGARRELLDFMLQGKINRGRHIDHPAGCHFIQTNQCPPPPSPHLTTKSAIYYLYLVLRPFNGLFFRTTWVSRHQEGKSFRILLEQETMGWQWHQLDHMQIIYTSLQTDNDASTSPLSFLQAGCPSCHPTNSVKHWRQYIILMLS